MKRSFAVPATFALAASIASLATSAMAADLTPALPDRPVADSQAVEVAAFARDARITATDARERLRWQTEVNADFADRARGILGDGFGGIWIDPDDGDRIKVGVADGADADEKVRAVAEASNIENAVDTVAVRYRYSDLVALHERLAKHALEANREAPGELMAALRPDRNAVELSVPEDGKLTEAQRAVVRLAHAAPDGQVLDATHGQPQNDACTNRYCDPPLRAALRINKVGTSSFCTAGFLARTRSGGAWKVMTAGHCLTSGSSWTSWYPTSGTTHTIGGAHSNAVNGPSGDAGIINILNPSGWDPRPWILVTDGPGANRDPQYPVRRVGGSTVGQRICMGGAGTNGTNCGNVTGLGLTFNGTNGLGRASYCRIGGDSGGPVFNYGTAHGLHKGGSGACVAYYQGALGAQNLLDVNIATTP